MKMYEWIRRRWSWATFLFVGMFLGLSSCGNAKWHVEERYADATTAIQWLNGATKGLVSLSHFYELVFIVVVLLWPVVWLIEQVVGKKGYISVVITVGISMIGSWMITVSLLYLHVLLFVDSWGLEVIAWLIRESILTSIVVNVMSYV